jgi:hypothetical protein
MGGLLLWSLGGAMAGLTVCGVRRTFDYLQLTIWICSGVMITLLCYLVFLSRDTALANNSNLVAAMSAGFKYFTLTPILLFLAILSAFSYWLFDILQDEGQHLSQEYPKQVAADFHLPQILRWGNIALLLSAAFVVAALLLWNLGLLLS